MQKKITVLSIFITIVICIIILVFTSQNVLADSKVITYTKTGSSNSFASQIWYDDGTYSGTLYKSGGPWVSSGSYTAAYYNSGTIIADSYVYSYYKNIGPDSGNYVSGSTIPLAKSAKGWTNYDVYYYNDGIDSGILNNPYFVETQLGWVSQTQYATDPTGAWHGDVGVEKKYNYSFYHPAVDTRQYSQNYTGTIYLNKDAVITTDIPSQIYSNQSYTFHVTAKNIGNYTWSEGSQFRLGTDGSYYSNSPSRYYLPTGVSIAPGQSYTWTINLTASPTGNYTFNFRMLQGNATWFGSSYNKTIPIIDNIAPKLLASSITGAQYINGADYWVQPYTNLYIYTRYYDGETGVKSVSLKNLSYDGFADNRLAYYWDTHSNVELMTSTFIKITNATEGYNTLNTKDTTFIVQPQNIEQNYHVYMASYDYAGNLDNFTKAIGNIRVDSTAPNGTVNISYDNTTANTTINVSDVTELGSGIKRIWVEYSSTDNPANIITEDLINNNGTYNGGKNLYNIFNGNANTVNIKVKAIDNVGNQSILSDTNNDVFTVNATITRVLSPHEPLFKSGEKGILNITVYGGVDTLQLLFPTELSAFDTTLNKTITLEPKVYDTISYQFFVPIDTISKDYNIQVTALKNGTSKVLYPAFSVDGSILDNIRTRIRRPT